MIPCDWHKPHGLGYISWFRWADEQTSKGDIQKQCRECLHWFFTKEFGKRPRWLKAIPTPDLEAPETREKREKE